MRRSENLLCPTAFCSCRTGQLSAPPSPGRCVWLSLVFIAGVLTAVPVAFAHDTWVETNTSVIRAGDAVFVDLKLGNHGNDHRDFKLASKVDLAGCKLQILLPNGAKYDMLDQLRDLGYAPKEGYWSGKFVCGAAGTHVVAHEYDQIVHHGRPTRSIKSGKCFFLSATQLDRVKDDSELWQTPLGHPLEIVPLSHPVLFTGPGMPVRVQVLRNGKPLADARVSFIPQGVTLAEGFDDTYERRTDENGQAAFTPRTGAKLLIVTHLRAEEEKSKDYDLTAYSATLHMIIPEICPCCQ